MSKVIVEEFDNAGNLIKRTTTETQDAWPFYYNPYAPYTAPGLQITSQPITYKANLKEPHIDRFWDVEHP